MKFERTGKVLMIFFSILIGFFSNAQVDSSATHWVDSVFNSLTPQERVTQLMLLRVSEKTATGVNFYDDKIIDAINTYNIGGVVLFQGGPVKQANMVNRFQAAAKTPLMVCIDAEWGLGMRYDSVLPLNHQLMLGAVQDASLVYDYGKLVANQCRRAGIHVNYAPVVDINNNPLNPVINDRSFGEDKYKVALLGKAYMNGLQDNGVMACAKHFPGHGDVSVDSHKDLPVINKSTGALDSLELYPFKELFKAGVASVMVAHLYIPAIDSSANRATSISKKNVTGLLRDDLHYQGLTFTDALNMQGVAKFFPGGEISAEALIAGNDMLCLPADIPGSIKKINKAITDCLLTEEDINSRCKKVLYAKYKYIGTQAVVIDTSHLAADLNDSLKEMKLRVAKQAITLLSLSGKLPQLSLDHKKQKTTAYVGIGISADNTIAKNLKSNYNADVFYYDYNDSANADSLANAISQRYKNIIVGIHGYARYPSNNFGISQKAIALANAFKKYPQTFTLVFGNPYAIKYFCDAPNLMACYEDDSFTQKIALEFLKGNISATGTLPVTVCNKYK
ncbi:MAG: glycoside hydrolase family 3 protein, partial [Ginsengibacter sp.]